MKLFPPGQDYATCCAKAEVALPTLPDASVDAVVTDPPYGLKFMSASWDSPDNVAFQPAFWREVFRVLKPGGHLLAFGGTRTFHRMICALEDAGFEVRDCLSWMYAQGMPKNANVSKHLDRMAGAEREVIGANPNHRPVSGVHYEGIYAGGNTGAPNLTAPATDAAKQWDGFGSALKPAWEPIVLCRKPLFQDVVLDFERQLREQGVTGPIEWK